MLGMVPGNGHPYSWSAIFNGYDRKKMYECPFPVIPKYLEMRPDTDFGIGGAKVTHIWCEDNEAARHVASCTFIQNVVKNPLDVIGQVDAVILPTDIGSEHVERARPFLEAGLPLFIDKPLTDNFEDLKQFVKWKNEGKRFLSSSCMRYAVEYENLKTRLGEIGTPRFITMTTPKSWERYGIHALEGVYPFFQQGQWRSVRNAGAPGRDVIHAELEDGVHVVLAAVSDLLGSFGCLSIHGTKGHIEAQFSDTFTAFKRQLSSFIDWLNTGADPFPFSETVELMKIIIAGQISGKENGRKIELTELALD